MSAEHRVYVRWLRYVRWTRVWAQWCWIRAHRVDGRDRFLWLALGPLDVRIHVLPAPCVVCGVRPHPSMASKLCPTCAVRREALCSR